MRQQQSIGLLGEQLAKQHLLNNGYRILHSRFTCRWGEIDLIACKDNKISFIEVKARISILKGDPYEAVTSLKIRHLSRPIQFYILQNNLSKYKLSLDVIAVYMDRDGSLKRLIHYENIGIPNGNY